MMQQWPYGANILIESTSCNFSENIEVGGADFLTSITKETEMTFKFIETNGTLVKIDTNLKISKPIVRDKKNNKIGTFTLTTADSNCSVTKTNREKPYINLCCNDVKVPIVFIGSNNKWDISIVEENDIILYGGGDDYIKIPRYIILNWSPTKESITTTPIMINKNVQESEEWYIFQAQYLYLDNNNKIQSDITTLYNNSGWANNDLLVIPKLNGTSSELSYNNVKITRKFYKYFILGVEIRLRDGYATYKSDTVYYIGGTNRTYDNTTFPHFINGVYHLETEEGFPKLNTELETKWNSDFFFITQKNKKGKSYYISPSTSQILTTYDLASWCIKDCECNAHCECDYNTETNDCYIYELCACYDFEEVIDNKLKKYDCQGYYTCKDDECDSVCIEFYDWKISGNCRKGYCSCDGYFDCDCDGYIEGCDHDVNDITCGDNTDPGEEGNTVTFTVTTGATQVSKVYGYGDNYFFDRTPFVCRVKPGTYKVAGYIGSNPVFETNNSETGYAIVP